MSDSWWWLLLVSVPLLMYGFEAAIGWLRVRRYMTQQGWTLLRARWRPLIPLRQVKFAVEAEQGSQRVLGTARAGGPWTGPVFSNLVEFELDDR